MDRLYRDLIICENTTELFVAPGFSKLLEGDLIEVDNSNAYFNVKKVCTINLTYQKDIVDFMVSMSGKPLLRKVNKKIEEIAFEYEKDEEDFIKDLIKREKENENE